MTISALASFWALSMLFVIIPGADWAYAISCGMRRAVIPAVSGLLLGHFAATVVVAAGVGALLTGAPGAMNVFSIVGAAYLAWLGGQLLIAPPTPGAIDAQWAVTWVDWVAKGFCVSGLNPKVFLLFLALLPQFAETSANWPVPAQILALGAVHIINCGVVYLLVGYGSQAVLRSRPRAARLIGRLSGGAMIAIAIVLVAERFA
ncbi:Threonine/homoserine/homoserine lactone efflux protein [Rhodoblastus acidophilus]|uniref:Threonine/homoserine/homoserine lactone efflux protein n=1 Tax=Rhodoblastus acidophilus TaxID=1074 RepID=A0A212R3D6_RHOAC|nr:LysE family translocator [Rhodoblastus acidophilus]PPQ40262.1 LysE family translocator [Rhodoblastus acidophilus]RAI19358.1 LysE family translocator [Rhodoblastus acidophilus]SNB66507.1 Threonine/homoserine/homoserine lactone efflux protein [Rhodoblastus acidophilus]